ncbi:MAG: hypothetical protein ACKOEV_06400 [Cytophagales bacterium]
MADNSSDIILYSSPEGLFGVEVPAVSKHLKNIFETGALQEDAFISKVETTEIKEKTA